MRSSPSTKQGTARAVPFGLVATTDATGVDLRCSLDEFARLPDSREVEFVPYIPGFGDLGATIAWPYYGASEQQLPVLVDRVPAGEVGIRRHEPVHAADGGAIGQVEGLVVDGESHITEVAIPIGSLEKIDPDGIHVQLSKSEIADLPELGVNVTW